MLDCIANQHPPHKISTSFGNIRPGRPRTDVNHGLFTAGADTLAGEEGGVIEILGGVAKERTGAGK